MTQLAPQVAALALVFAALGSAAGAQARSAEPPAGLDDGAAQDDDGPPLPAGLGDDAAQEDDGPPLPAGLGDDAAQADDGPPLPAGLGGGAADARRVDPEPAGLPMEWQLSADARAGARLVADPFERAASLAEVRLQLDLSKSFRPWSTTARFVVDAVGDLLADDQAPAFETGQGAIDVRTASLTMTPSDHVDVRVGRQILTWGTGDLVFVNDLFPKDWTAFLIGRDIDYLKAPSDALKLAVFTPAFGVNIVATPRFDADRPPRRDRVSSWEPSLGRIAGEDAPLALAAPDDWITDGELAVRLHRTVASWELAGYAYAGFWKSPAGADAVTGRATFPALSVYGASLRGPVLRGIASAELGYYDSRDDRGGSDPLVRNSELRALASYERQVARDLSASAQYYLEGMVGHDAYAANLPPGVPAADELRHVVTARVRWLALRQRLQLSLFGAGSPSDRDLYLRPTASYAIDDHWTAFAGANLLAGADDHTFFGQLENNTNVYAGLRFAR